MACYCTLAFICQVQSPGVYCELDGSGRTFIIVINDDGKAVPKKKEVVAWLKDINLVSAIPALTLGVWDARVGCAVRACKCPMRRPRPNRSWAAAAAPRRDSPTQLSHITLVYLYLIQPASSNLQTQHFALPPLLCHGRRRARYCTVLISPTKSGKSTSAATADQLLLPSFTANCITPRHAISSSSRKQE